MTQKYTLTEAERNTIVCALYLARDKYLENVITLRTGVDIGVDSGSAARLISQFELQAAHANDVAELLEAADVISYEVTE